MAGVPPSGLDSRWWRPSCFVAAADEIKFPSPTGKSLYRSAEITLPRSRGRAGWGQWGHPRLLRLPRRAPPRMDLGGARLLLARRAGCRRLRHGIAGANV